MHTHLGKAEMNMPSDFNNSQVEKIVVGVV